MSRVLLFQNGKDNNRLNLGNDNHDLIVEYPLMLSSQLTRYRQLYDLPIHHGRQVFLRLLLNGYQFQNRLHQIQELLRDKFNSKGK